MQNNILLPNSNVAPLSGMARGSESSGAVRRASAHNIPENDPHFQDSTFKKGFMKLGQKMGIVEKPRRKSETQWPMDEKHQVLGRPSSSLHSAGGGGRRKSTTSSGPMFGSFSSESRRDSYAGEGARRASLTDQAILKDFEDARARRASIQGCIEG